jgi:hypothetical protein
MQRSRCLEIPESLMEAVRPDRAAVVIYDMQVGIVRQLPSAPAIIAMSGGCWQLPESLVSASSSFGTCRCRFRWLA